MNSQLRRPALKPLVPLLKAFALVRTPIVLSLRPFVLLLNPFALLLKPFFVSETIDAITENIRRCGIWEEDGRVRARGPIGLPHRRPQLCVVDGRLGWQRHLPNCLGEA